MERIARRVTQLRFNIDHFAAPDSAPVLTTLFVLTFAFDHEDPPRIDKALSLLGFPNAQDLAGPRRTQTMKERMRDADRRAASSARGLRRYEASARGARCASPSYDLLAFQPTSTHMPVYHPPLAA
ncbi:hypothetical protein C8F01DRAFT_1244182 [Mycena amicta]|nr:hypothetical protein C8F01DRAFT_1244182 [Mycena amicta]